MCGIGGYLVHNPGTLDARVLDRLARSLMESLDLRGGDASGIVALSASGERYWRKGSCDAYRFGQYWRTLPVDVSAVLVHTRLATQGDACFPENNHPVKVGPLYCVHNGHVTNDAALLLDARDGEVDSEAIPATILDAGGLDATAAGLARVRGDAAIGIVDEGQPARLVLGRSRNSPLYVHRNRDVTAFASTGEILARAWNAAFGGTLRSLGRPMVEGTVLDVTPSGIARHTFEPASPAWTPSRWTDGQAWTPAKPHAAESSWRTPVAAACDKDLGAIAAQLLEDRNGYVYWQDLEECELCGDYYAPSRIRYRSFEGHWTGMCDGCEDEAIMGGLIHA